MHLLPRFLVVLLALAAAAPSLTAAVEIGAPAPDFTLADLGGTKHRLADFHGKYVVLEWTNQGCPFVKKFYVNGDMQRFQKEWTAQGVVWLTINSTNPEHQDFLTAAQHQKLEEEQKSAMTAKLLDPDGTVGKLYGARTTPHFFVIDPAGKLIYQGAIDSVASTKPQDVAKAENYVAQALTQAKAGQPVATPSTKPYGCSVKYR